MGLKFHSKNRLKSLNTRHGTSHGGVSVYMGRDGRCTSASGTPARYSARRRTPRICPAITAFQGEPPSISAKDAAGPSPSSAPAVDHVQLVLRDIASPSRIAIAQIAPAVRVSIGEELGLPPGTLATGKLVAALRRLGFDYVFDVVSAADITIMEEGTELLHRLRNGGTLPMMTSCCPGWIEFVEKCAPQFIPNLSTAKSPHMMGGSLIKAFFSEALGVTDRDMSVTSIMPCVRKQGEADRIFFQTTSGARQVDHVLTTKDVAQLLKARDIDFASLPDEHFDDFMGLGTGAGAIFGTTGGVMEAALRTVVEIAGGKLMGKPEYTAVRGFEGLKEATVTIPPNPEGPLKNNAPVEVRVAVANGLGNAKKLLKDIEEGTCKYHFIEVMACPGGCIGGGGQPRSKDKQILAKRQAALYSVDERSSIRRSHENPVVREIYTRYLGEPYSEKAEELLHTQYVECGPGKFDIAAPAPVPGTCTLVENEECDEEICRSEEEEACEQLVSDVESTEH